MRKRTLSLALIFALFVCSCHNKEMIKSQPGSLTKSDSMKLNLKNDGPYLDFTQFDSVRLDIPYTNSNNPFQRLDIIYPWNGKAPFKFLMTFHGGGWAGGCRKGNKVVDMQYAATQGYAVVNVDYRLRVDALWPAFIYDAKAAVRFIRANAVKYHLDATNICVIGESAGGHIAELLGATNGNSEYEYLSMGNPKTSSDVQCVVSWYGVSDMTDLPSDIPSADDILGFNAKAPENKRKADKASPICLVTKNYPPIILSHGTADNIVPFNQSVDLMKKVNSVCGEGRATLKIVKDGGHVDRMIRCKKNLLDDLNFVDKVLFPDGDNPYRNETTVAIKTLKRL